MKKNYFLWAVFVLLSVSVFARQITLQEARQVAQNFFFERLSQYEPVDYQTIRITESVPRKEGELTFYYVFNFYDHGYVIVSAIDAVIPVLAYSYETVYDPDNEAPQFTAWMKQYSDQIRFAFNNNIKPSKPVSELWSHLLVNDPAKLKPFKGGRDVLPLINSNWDQGSLYNEMCPADDAGPGGHAYAGCVPTAMGQIMYYYRWPDHGTGSYAYTDPTYGLISANFDSTWYQWDNMKNSINKSNHGIAELLFHLGVSCDLVYGPGGSGMYNHKAAYALRTFFRYAPETRYIFRDSTNLKWDSIIIAHLQRRMPLYYAGWSLPNVNGHAFVCDGYQGGDYFHFNFGWSGNSNGYFYLDSITAGGGSFNLAQELIVNIYPDTLNNLYPKYCPDYTLLNYPEGSLEDGSGPLNDYKPGYHCNWLIDPQTDTDSISRITLTFDRMQTLPGDVVTVYDGNSGSAPVLGSFSGSSLPPVVNSTGNKMLVTFKTESGSGAPGWSATYTTTSPNWCGNITSISADTLDLTDGSKRFNYHNNTNCRWNLSSKLGDTLTVFFKSFDTEPGKDILRIYNPDSMNTPLAVISGHYDSLQLPSPVVSPSGKMLLLFLTNSTVTGKGWHIYYPKSTVGLKEKKSISDFIFFPNPAKKQVTIQFSSETNTEYEIGLSTADGRNLIHEVTKTNPGRNRMNMDVSSFSPGIYLLSVRGKEFLTTKKLVITE